MEKESQDLLRQMLNEAKEVVRLSAALPVRDAMMVTRKRGFWPRQPSTIPSRENFKAFIAGYSMAQLQVRVPSS